jgi:hypothetical protein
MKKAIFAAFMLLAVAGTTIAQTPAKKDTSSSKHAGKMHHKSHPAKKDEPAKKP